MTFFTIRQGWAAKAWLFCLLAPFAQAAEIEESQVGAWYVYAFSNDFADSRFGIQGDLQYRSWNAGEDLQQILLRASVSYRPDSLPGKYAIGVASITSGQFGESDARTAENRIFQEVQFAQETGGRVLLSHRFRFEQRWIQGQEFRTRLRYAVSASIGLNRAEMTRGTWYLALSNELFLNGERGIGGGREVDIYDRDRLYAGLGYQLSDNGKLQVGYMQQHTDAVSKGQVQMSLQHRF